MSADWLCANKLPASMNELKMGKSKLGWGMGGGGGCCNPHPPTFHMYTWVSGQRVGKLTVLQSSQKSKYGTKKNPNGGGGIRPLPPPLLNERVKLDAFFSVIISKLTIFTVPVRPVKACCFSTQMNSVHEPTQILC